MKQIIKEIKEIKSTPKELREFGLVVGGVFAAITAFLVWRGRTPVALGVLAAALITLGLVKPSLLKPVQKVWMAFAVVMGFVMTHVIMVVLFFVVLTPIGFFSRLFGKKFLDLSFRDPVQKTYWITRPPMPPKEQYEKQY